MKKPLTLEQLIAKRQELLIFRSKYRRDLDRRTLKDLDRRRNMTEIIERGIIHFFSSAGVYLIALTGFWLLERKVRWWPKLHGWWALILPALLSFMVISFREIFDVAAGGLLVKSISDWISWILGLGVSVWALYRLTPRLNECLGEIEGASKRAD